MAGRAGFSFLLRNDGVERERLSSSRAPDQGRGIRSLLNSFFFSSQVPNEVNAMEKNERRQGISLLPSRLLVYVVKLSSSSHVFVVYGGKEMGSRDVRDLESP